MSYRGTKGSKRAAVPRILVYSLYYGIVLFSLQGTLSASMPATPPPSQPIILRIANPTDKGLLAAVVDPIKAAVVRSVVFVPSKGTRYFAGIADVTVAMTDHIALKMTTLGPDPVSAAAINAERSKVPEYLKKGAMTILKISDMTPGLTQADIVLSIDHLLLPKLTANPRASGTTGLPTEVVFKLIKAPKYTEDDRKRLRKIHTCPLFGTCAFPEQEPGAARQGGTLTQ